VFRKKAAKNGRYNFYYRNREVVAVCKHHTACQFAEDDATEFRAVCSMRFFFAVDLMIFFIFGKVLNIIFDDDILSNNIEAEVWYTVRWS
jgi:hypothetical protein